jgi:hypothetical protein
LVADAACAALESAGIRCWIAPRDIPPGDDWSAASIRAIDQSKVMVLIFSSNANESTEIPREVQRAANRKVRIVTVRIDGAEPAEALEYYLGPVQWFDALPPPVENHLQRLARDIRAILEPPAVKKGEPISKEGVGQQVRKERQQRHRMSSGEALQFYSCFISYSSKDQVFADRLHADLQNKGVRCWFAPHDLPIGAKTWDAIDEAIRLRDKLLIILSEASIASDWVEDEVSKAFAEERERNMTILFPIRIDDAVMTTSEAWATKLRDQRNVGDFRQWKEPAAYQKSVERLLRDLKAPV